MLSENDVAEVDCWVFNLDESLLASANQWNIDSSSLTKNREDRVDVFVKLRGECDRDSGGETSGHSTGWSVLNVEEVLDLILKRQQFE